MPLFEYTCESCNHEFELLVGQRETPKCPTCASTQLTKLMSAGFGRVSTGAALPMSDSCPPPSAGPCSPHCCRLP